MPELKNMREEKFCQAIVNGLNQKDATIAAGYSAKTATQAGYRMAKLDRIQERIMEIRAEKIKEVGLDDLFVYKTFKKAIVRMEKLADNAEFDRDKIQANKILLETVKELYKLSIFRDEIKEDEKAELQAISDEELLNIIKKLS